MSTTTFCDSAAPTLMPVHAVALMIRLWWISIGTVEIGVRDVDVDGALAAARVHREPLQRHVEVLDGDGRGPLPF